jgi:hypothetical protein
MMSEDPLAGITRFFKYPSPSHGIAFGVDGFGDAFGVSFSSVNDWILKEKEKWLCNLCPESPARLDSNWVDCRPCLGAHK